MELIHDTLSTSDNHRQAALTALVARIIEQTAALPEKTQRELAEQHDVLGMLGQCVGLCCPATCPD